MAHPLAQKFAGFRSQMAMILKRVTLPKTFFEAGRRHGRHRVDMHLVLVHRLHLSHRGQWMRSV